MTSGEAFARHPLWRPIPADWKLSRLEKRGSLPSAWIPATVPGAVQLDWARAHGLPDPAYGENFRSYDGLEDYHWLYRTRVPKVSLEAGEQLFFSCAGVDYACEVRVGGRVVLEHEGMFSSFEIPVAGCAAGTELEILVLPAPKRHGAPADRTQASDSCKPAVSYGWDWHPRLIPLGLWAGAGFCVRPRAHVRHADFKCTLTDDLSRADIVLSIEATGLGEPRWRLLDLESRPVIETASFKASLPNPRLWWTHDQGEPALYTLEVTLPEGDVYRRQVGFRKVRLVMHEGAWGEPLGFPASRSSPPVTVELNGRVVFAKGSNWVSTDIFPGRVTAETLRPLLQLAKDAHFNLLRSWGGAIVNPEPFFDQCDRLGLLVWQEFPLACNNYPDDEAYLEILDQESRAIIRRLRQHPCLAIWGGGNELFNSWSGMTDQSLALRLLNRNCFDLDPGTPFLPTAPIGGMGHGDYRFRDGQGREVYEIFQKARNTAYSEFGCPGPAPVEALKSFIPEAELWPPRASGSWKAHHAFGAWEADPTSWLFPATPEHYFGAASDLDTLVERATWLQCAGYQSIFEEARRQKPRCSMALNWCFNEAWPTAAGNALVGWPATPKAAYYAVQSACRAVIASARFAKFQWTAGEAFCAEIWILNDAPSDIPVGDIEVTLDVGGTSTRLLLWSHPKIAACTNQSGPTARFVLPNVTANAFELKLIAGPGNCWGSSYRLSLLSGNPQT
jgi:beta-mannosidase